MIRIAPFLPTEFAEGSRTLVIDDDWLPTRENIEALPLPLRSWIMLLETRWDPADDLRERVLLRDLVLELQAALAELQA